MTNSNAFCLVLCALIHHEFACFTVHVKPMVKIIDHKLTLSPLVISFMNIMFSIKHHVLTLTLADTDLPPLVVKTVL